MLGNRTPKKKMSEPVFSERVDQCKLVPRRKMLPPQQYHHHLNTTWEGGHAEKVKRRKRRKRAISLLLVDAACVLLLRQGECRWWILFFHGVWRHSRGGRGSCGWRGCGSLFNVSTAGNRNAQHEKRADTQTLRWGRGKRVLP